MKFGKILVTGLLTAALLIPTSGAARSHSHGPETPPIFEASAWAQPELQKAHSLGLLWDGLAENYRDRITRADFCRMMLNYLAVQLNTDPDDLVDMANLYLKKTDEAMFSDCADPNVADRVTAAYRLGLVQGKAPGIFDPDGPLTREEAAVMLTRAQEILGCDLPEAAAPDYTDSQYIARWAADSVAILADWDVMHGMAYGRFNPRNDLTVQECAAVCLRLHQKSPVGVEKGNVTPCFTYDQAMDFLRRMEDQAHACGTGFFQTLEVTGSEATMVRMDWAGSMHGASRLYFACRDGGLATFEIGLCLRFNALTPDLPLENPRFSADGKTFLCEVRLTENSRDGFANVITHQKGLYHVTVDVATCQVTLDREDLPA